MSKYVKIEFEFPGIFFTKIPENISHELRNLFVIRKQKFSQSHHETDVNIFRHLH